MQELIQQLYGYLYAMWRYRWSALLISWVIALTGWLVVFVLPDQYQATAVVHVDTESIMKPLLKGLAVETDATDELQVITRVLLSRENLQNVIQKTDMDLEANTVAERDKLIGRLSDKIEIAGGSGRNNNIYEISYSDTSAQRVYQVVSYLVNNLIENTLSSSRSDTVSAQKFLDSQIKEYEQRLSVAEERLSDFKRKNVGFMPDEKGGYYQRLQLALQNLETTKRKINLAERKYQELNKQVQGESPILDDSSYGAVSAVKLRKYREELENLLSQYTEQHPDVQSLRAKIIEIQSGATSSGLEGLEPVGSSETVEFNPIYQELKVELNKTSVELETLKIELAERQTYVEKLRESIDVIPAVEAELAKLNRGYEVTKERYLDLVERRESARLAQMAGQSGSDVSFRIIEPPRVPKRPSAPNRPLFLSAVLLVALFIGAGWSLLMYFLRPTYLNLKQLQSSVGLPVLGSVSLYLTPEHSRRRLLQLKSYLAVLILLFGVFVSAVLFKDQGAAVVSAMLERVINT